MEIKGSRSILGRFWRDLLETDMKRGMRLLYEEKEGSVTFLIIMIFRIY